MRMCRISLFCFRYKNSHHHHVQRPWFPKRGQNFVDTVNVSFRHIFTAHVQKWLFRSVQATIWPHYSIRQPRFLQDGYIYTTRWRLRHIFDVFFWFSCVLVTLTFDFLTLPVSHASYIQFTYQFWASYDYPSLSYRLISLIIFPSRILCDGHCTCAVSRDLSLEGRGSEWSAFLKSLTLIYLLT